MSYFIDGAYIEDDAFGDAFEPDPEIKWWEIALAVVMAAAITICGALAFIGHLNYLDR